MKLLVSGATGLVGSRLVQRLEADGHQVVRLTRSPKTAQDVGWQPNAGVIDPDAFRDVEAVVHLAGENIAGGRWTEARKRRILDSRVQGTTVIAEGIAAHSGIHTFVSASAVGYYGDRGDTIVDESNAPGEGFLADVCQAWEASSTPAGAAGVRVVNTRFGAILSKEGGMLTKMLTPFKLGLGGVVGSGDQWLSWVTLDDVVETICFLLEQPDLDGPINLTAPEPVTNRDFTRALGDALGRPTVVPLPAFAARTVFGEMADELLLASTRVAASRLTEAGFAFRSPSLGSALRDLLDS